MWPFGKGSRQKAHQDLVALAQEVLKRFPPPRIDSEDGPVFDVSSQPLEFRSTFRSRLPNLHCHVELFRDPKEVGNSRNIQELTEDLRVLQLCLGGIMTPAARLTFRASTYAELFKEVSEMVEHLEESPHRAEWLADAAQERIVAGREALTWFPDEAALSAARQELAVMQSTRTALPRAAAIALLEKLEAIVRAAQQSA